MNGIVVTLLVAIAVSIVALSGTLYLDHQMRTNAHACRARVCEHGAPVYLIREGACVCLEKPR